MLLEDFWREVVNRFETPGTLANNLDELWIAISHIFNAMDSICYLNDAIHTIPEKFRKVVKNDGSWINAN